MCQPRPTNICIICVLLFPTLCCHCPLLARVRYFSAIWLSTSCFMFSASANTATSDTVCVTGDTSPPPKLISGLNLESGTWTCNANPALKTHHIVSYLAQTWYMSSKHANCGMKNNWAHNKTCIVTVLQKHLYKEMVLVSHGGGWVLWSGFACQKTVNSTYFVSVFFWVVGVRSSTLFWDPIDYILYWMSVNKLVNY